MTITLDKQTENILLEIAKNSNLNPQKVVYDVIDNFIANYRSKKTDEIATKIANGYKEAVNARKNGIKLQSLDELLDEL